MHIQILGQINIITRYIFFWWAQKRNENVYTRYKKFFTNWKNESVINGLVCLEAFFSVKRVENDEMRLIYGVCWAIFWSAFLFTFNLNGFFKSCHGLASFVIKLMFSQWTLHAVATIYMCNCNTIPSHRIKFGGKKINCQAFGVNELSLLHFHLLYFFRLHFFYYFFCISCFVLDFYSFWTIFIFFGTLPFLIIV